MVLSFVLRVVWFSLLAVAATAPGVHARPARLVASLPRDVAVLPDESALLVANEGDGTLLLVDIDARRVVSRLKLGAGGRPRSVSVVALSSAADDAGATPRSRRYLAAVSERYAHRVSLLDVVSFRLRLRQRLPSGRLPGDVLLDGPGQRLLVACEGDGSVWEYATATGRLLRRLPAVEGVRRICLRSPGGTGGGHGGPRSAPPGRRLAFAGRTEVGELDLQSGSVIWSRSLSDAEGLNLNAIAFVGERLAIAHQVKPTESVIAPQMVVWGLILANRLTLLGELEAGDVEPGRAPRRSSSRRVEAAVVPLDQRHRAHGDPEDMVVLPRAEGSPLVVLASGGTSRLLFIDPEAHGAGHSSLSLTREDRLPSLSVARRPVALAVAPRRRRIYVANHLADSIQVVDPAARRVTATLALTKTANLTQEIAGAHVFYDARRSRGGWYSCHSCHPDGATRGHRFDTEADAGGLAKVAPALAGVVETGPWSWIGGFDSLADQLAASLHGTMAVDKPPPRADVERLSAFLATLTRPGPTPADLDGGDPARGREVFRKARCDRCHPPPLFTSAKTYNIGVRDELTGRKRFNPPSLRGVRDRFRYLHDGRARTIESVFREHTHPGKHSGAQLDDQALRDLAAYLKTL